MIFSNKAYQITSSHRFGFTVLFVVAWTTALLCPVREASGQSDKTKTASATAVNSKERIRVSGWPFQSQVNQFHIYSVVPIDGVSEQFNSLRGLPQELADTLQITITREPIHVVIVENRKALDEYVKGILPTAPSRQALYIRHRGPGLVLTYSHPGWLHDVRHECTHALLDASGMTLPQWVDEGLAEYFETPGELKRMHPTHLAAIRAQVRYGQLADLERLERMDGLTEMTAKDYREAWCVTAYLLNASEHTRSAYQAFLGDNQNKRGGGFLSHRLAINASTWRDGLLQFYNNP